MNLRMLKQILNDVNGENKLEQLPMNNIDPKHYDDAQKIDFNAKEIKNLYVSLTYL